ncbi:uncharacterized protein LOC122069123 [Macadamia integrifolia]|uniref:uncharacterized protein LOC122069123 n=1 Tax=Macadamia integrifolia TaxID=60698 RepID=UPI001C4F628A|nr:uncharacterized protein LOC122069123 [Macadamia integrifolia]
MGQLGYCVYDLTTHCIFTSRDVIFREYIFPFQQESSPSPWPSIPVPNVIPDFSMPESGFPVMDTSPSTAIPTVVSDSSSSPISSNPPPRHSMCPHVPSSKLQDYIYTAAECTSSPLPHFLSFKPPPGNPYPIQHFLSFPCFSTAPRAFIAFVLSDEEPKSFTQANKVPVWREAMATEMKALELNNTWIIRPLPNGKWAIGCKWLVTIRGLVTIATAKNWFLYQLDVHNALLDEEVYMQIPPGFQCEGENMSTADYSFLTFKCGDLLTVVLVYVDDIIISGTRFPMEQHLKFPSTHGTLLPDPATYCQLVGRLIYLTITRSDLTFVVHVLSQLMHQPHVSHLSAAHRVFQYLKGSPSQGLLMSSASSFTISAYCDSDWARCPLTRRSTSGYITFLGSSPISQQTKKQSTISRSSAEAKYRSIATASCELTWLKNLFADLGISHSDPVHLYCDNKASIHIVANPVFHERTKHIEIDCHLIREKIQRGLIRIFYVSSPARRAYIFTKALGLTQFHSILHKLGVYPPSQLEGEC